MNVPAMTLQEEAQIWVDDYAALLYRRAYVLVRRREVAEDLVQETFLAAILAPESMRKAISIKSWLMTILRNKAVDYIRRTLKSEHDSLDESSLENDRSQCFTGFGVWNRWRSSWRDSPETVLEQKQFLQQMEVCINKLPHSVRTVFMLRTVEGLTTEEICGRLDLFPNNAWVLFYRARLNLSECLDLKWFTPAKKNHA